MGLTISSKRYSCDMGYGGFNRFRTTLAKQVNEEVHSHYAAITDSSIMYMFGKERDEYFEKYDAETERLISDGKLPDAVANFLYQSDCSGKIDRKQAKMIYELIKDCDDDLSFGYSGRADCARMADMKNIFSDKTKVEWC